MCQSTFLLSCQSSHRHLEKNFGLKRYLARSCRALVFQKDHQSGDGGEKGLFNRISFTGIQIQELIRQQIMQQFNPTHLEFKFSLALAFKKGNIYIHEYIMFWIRFIKNIWIVEKQYKLGSSLFSMEETPLPFECLLRNHSLPAQSIPVFSQGGKSHFVHKLRYNLYKIRNKLYTVLNVVINSQLQKAEFLLI